MDLSDFSEGTKASASYERQRRRITGDNDGEDDDDGGHAGITTRTGARVYATGITAKRSEAVGGVGTLFIIPTISGASPYFLSRSSKKRLLARRRRSSSFRVSVVSFLEARPHFAFLTVAYLSEDCRKLTLLCLTK